MNYYNEFDPKAAAWLRELIKAGLIPAGNVDERSITEIKPDELSKYTQCHFFAGIGGWSLALELAGWPSDRPVWTGSCPCQPFSSAGKQLGAADERHLWPAFFNLIRQCRPESVFGEQVATAIGKGWLDGVSADLEQEGYACGATVLGAHSVGSPHIRQRLYWVADANSRGCVEFGQFNGSKTQPGQQASCGNDVGGCGGVGGLVHPFQSRLEGHPGHGDHRDQPGRINQDATGSTATAGSLGHWSAYDFLPCTDGKTRRIEPGSFPLAHGIPGRVGLLRGYGNAIVPQVAAAFIEATY